MKQFLLLFCITIMVAGCISSGPQNNVGFGRIEKPTELEGVYKNLGEGGKASLSLGSDMAGGVGQRLDYGN